MEYNQPIEQAVLTAIGLMAIDDRESLINMLSASGSIADASMSKEKLIDLTLKALVYSPKFRMLLNDYLKGAIEDSLTQEVNASFSGNDDFFNMSDDNEDSIINIYGYEGLSNEEDEEDDEADEYGFTTEEHYYNLAEDEDGSDEDDDDDADFSGNDDFFNVVESEDEDDEDDDDESDFDGDDGYSNLATKQTYRQVNGTTRVGDTLRSIFNKETIGALFQGGVQLATNSITSKQERKGNQQAIDYANAQANLLAQQSKATELQQNVGASNVPTFMPNMGGGDEGGGGKKPDTKPKWILPVAIGGGVLVLGTIIFLVVKK